MNLRQLEIFRAVMETGTVTGAAARLHISQPAVSKQLRTLEENLGFAVFDRTHGRLIATAEAHALYDQAERVSTGVDQLQRFGSDLNEAKRGHLVVAALPMLSNRWLPGVVGRFLAQRPRVTVAVQTRTSIKVAEWVAAQQVDVGIGLLPADDTVVIERTLMRIEAVCAMPVNHPLAEKTIICPQDLDGQAFISLSTFDHSRALIDLVLEEAGARPRRRIDTVMANTACAFVAQGLGVSILDALSVRENHDLGLIARPFQPRIEFEIKLLRPVYRPRSRLADAFVAELDRCATEEHFENTDHDSGNIN